MKQAISNNFKPKTNILLNFASTLSAVFIAVVAALSFAGNSPQPVASAATNSSPAVVQQADANTDQSASACTVPSSHGGGSGSASSITSAFHPNPGPMSHFTRHHHNSTSNTTTNNTTTASNSYSNTTNSVDSHDRTTNILSNNTTSVLSDIANGNTVNVPILNNSVNGNTVLSNNPILSNNTVEDVLDIPVLGTIL